MSARQKLVDVAFGDVNLVEWALSPTGPVLIVYARSWAFPLDKGMVLINI